MKEYLLGKNIRLWASFTDPDDDSDVDPTTVTLLLRKPDGTETSHVYLTDVNVIKDSVGHYSYVLSPATVDTGTWRHRWKATGSAFVTAGEEKFKVLASEFTTP